MGTRMAADVPADLPAHYSRFRVAERILLTGHSHQAWPDVGFEAQQRAWLDAAEYVDDKWPHAEAQAALVREGFAALLGDRPEHIALGQNTHELVVRWLSALPLSERPRLVTTDGEFHSIRRQLDRLAEERLDVVKVSAAPAGSVAERLARAVTDRTAAVLVSSVLFQTAEIVAGLGDLAAACAYHGAELLIDAYHHLNVVPFDIAQLGLQNAFVTGGGYKYCQLGEGNCFLRVPPGRRMRPVLTGWFAELAELDAAGSSAGARLRYGEGAAAFAGSTYDPASHYRAAAVFAFHCTQSLTAERLRAINVRQVKLLEAAFEALDLDRTLAHVEPMAAGRRGGFLALRTIHASPIVSALRARRVHVDARGDVLRLGPAPYVSDLQLQEAIAALGEALRATRR